jgi:hypothetical protein
LGGHGGYQRLARFVCLSKSVEEFQGGWVDWLVRKILEEMVELRIHEEARYVVRGKEELVSTC